MNRISLSVMALCAAALLGSCASTESDGAAGDGGVRVAGSQVTGGGAASGAALRDAGTSGGTAASRGGASGPSSGTAGLAAGGGGATFGGTASTSFTVTSVSPQGEVSSAVSFPSVQVQFSEPVVALSKLGEPSSTSNAVTITPAVNGTFRWYGTSLLSFDCADELIPQKEYTIQVNPALTSIHGTAISGQLAYTFRTEEMRLRSIEPGYTARKSGNRSFSSNDIPPEYARDIALTFANRVNAAVVAPYVSVVENGRPHSFRVQQVDEKTILVRIADTFARNSQVDVIVAKGAIPDKDCIATSAEQRQSFHTLRPLELTGTTGTSTLTLTFSHRLAEGSEDAVYSALSFSPKMDVAASQVAVRGNSVVISDLPVTYGDTYSFSLNPNAVRDVYGQPYAQKIEKTVDVPDADSYASFRDGNFIIVESQFTPQRAFEFQNILDKSNYTLTPLHGVSAAYKKPGARTFSIQTTEQTKNRRVIQTVPLAEFLEQTAGGYRGAVKFESTAFYTPYYGTRNARENLATTSYIQVTDLGVSVHSAWNETAVMVTGMSDGRAVSGATVSVYVLDDTKDQNEAMLLGQGARLTQSKTDADGLAVLRFDSAGHVARYIEVQTSDDRVVIPLNRWSAGGYYSAKIEDGTIIAVNADGSDGATLDAQKVSGTQQVAHLFSDRGLYRPGETASIKVIDRTLALGQYTTYTGPYEIRFVDNNWRRDRKVFASVTGNASSQGTASAEWKIPEDIAPGTYYVEYKRTDGSNLTATQSISVQFFERLRFQASAEVTPVVYTRGDAVTATVTASYLGGGSLAGANVHADWTRNATTFTPAGEQYEGYAFGPLLYGWSWRGYADEEEYDAFHEQGDETLSQDGTAHLSVATGSEPKTGAAYTYSLEAQVTDAGNQMIAARASAVVHPASFYIGLSGIKNVKGFPKKGERLLFDCVLATPEGQVPQKEVLPANGKVQWKLTRKAWEEETYLDEYGYEQVQWSEKTVTESSGWVSTPSAKGITFGMTPTEGGSYLLTLTAQDAQGRTAVTQRSFYVTGSDNYWRADRDGYELELTADKAEYEPGDTAHLLLESPLPKGRYLLTVEREGILSEQVLTLEENSAVIDVPIKESYVPVVWVGISTYVPRGGEPPADYDTTDTHKPLSVFASQSLRVSKKSRAFDVTVTRDKNSYRPGGQATIELSATKDGAPVSGAELTLMVVDRGVLDLIGYSVENPLDLFYAEYHFAGRSSRANSYSYVVDPVTYGTYTLSARERQMVMYERMYKTMATADMAAGSVANAPMMADFAVAEEAAEAEDDMDGGAENGEVQVRRDFRATAAFLPTLVTGSDGKVTATFTLPDSLTEYAVTVVGVRDQNYGYARDALTVANPISVRDVETRILRPGDEGEAGVVITNIGDADETVEVTFDVLPGLERTGYEPGAGDVAKLPGAAEVLGAKTKRVTVAPGQTQTLMFRVNAEADGWITLSFRVRSAQVNEVVYKPLEIEKPYIYETVTTVGQVGQDEDAAQEKIVFPAGTDDGRGSLYVQLDATRLGTLTSAVNYVFHYPYGCLEQRSSAVLPLVAFGQYIDVFGLQNEVGDAFAVVRSELADWAKVQKTDGGFPYWSDGKESSFAVSLRIAEVIALAKQHGIEVPASLDVQNLASFIQGEVERLMQQGSLGRYAQSYAYYVLARLGGKVAVPDVAGIVADKDCGVSELAFAGLTALELGERTLSQEAARKIKNYIALTARGASFQATAKRYGWYFYNTDSERYALSLHLLTLLDAEDTYNAHLVWQVLQMQKAGRGWWQSTASTSRMLIALEAYIQANRLDDTDFSAQALLGGHALVDGTFKGVAASPVDKTYRFAGLSNQNVKPGDTHYSAEWDELPTDIPFGTEVPLDFAKDGTGTLFYTASMTYAIPVQEQQARDEGLCVYVEITDARTGQPVTPGELTSGTIYREKVYVTTTKERTFVAVRAPVPAGAEILNAAFQTTATVVADGEGAAKRSPWWQYRMSHQDIYDAELRCFWDYLPIGSQSFEFLFRAERTGTYQTPATLAECMYEPEVFGRSDGAVWVIR